MQGKPQEVLSCQDELKKCSLLSPSALQISRLLSENGMQIDDTFTAEDLVEKLYKKLQNKGAGIRSTEREGKEKVVLQDENDARGRVSCRRLSYVYNKTSAFAAHALNDVSLQVNGGEFFVKFAEMLMKREK